MIDRANLLRSAQRALLGSVGPSIQAVAIACHELDGSVGLVLTVFVDVEATDAEIEDFDADTGGQIIGDFPSVNRYDFRVVRGDPVQIPSTPGEWVFVRRDVRIAQPPRL
jgi:hypothetical protein